MTTRTRRKKRTSSLEATTGETEADEEGDDNNSQLSKVKHGHNRKVDASKFTNPIPPASLSSLAGELFKFIFCSNHT